MRRDYNCGMSCAQIATMPTNKTIEASAAASSTNVFNMTLSPRTYKEHCSFFVLRVNVFLKAGKQYR